ncbi:hypothetical protein [Aeromonas veronii]|uniref:hypothetical protein n=1 Tax=Aeromonas veronii TaxID=654 RepID=UPI002444722E|nr:hypothetical protein [Aeromonas veronii]
MGDFASGCAVAVTRITEEELKDGAWHGLKVSKVDDGITSTRPPLVHVCKTIAAIEKMASGEYEVFCDPAPIVGFVKLLLIFKEK